MCKDATPLYFFFLQIPIPALTICPATKFQKQLLNFTDFREKLKNGSSPETISTENYTWSQIHNFYRLNCDLDYLDEDTRNDVAENFSYTEMLEEFSPKAFIVYCVYQGTKIENCDHLFKKVIIQDGLCYSLNLLAPFDMYNENV